MSRHDPPPEPPVPSRGQHLANISFDGRIWDVFLEFEQDPPPERETYRAQLCFSPSDLNDGESPTRTTFIIVERTYDDAIRQARSIDERQLLNLLRSTLPD